MAANGRVGWQAIVFTGQGVVLWCTRLRLPDSYTARGYQPGCGRARLETSRPCHWGRSTALTLPVRAVAVFQLTAGSATVMVTDHQPSAVVTREFRVASNAMRLGFSCSPRSSRSPRTRSSYQRGASWCRR